MNTAAAIKAIDLAVAGLMAFLNVIGASQVVSAIVARRIAENREWTDEERAEVQADLDANRAYAAEQIAKAQGLPS